MPTEATKGKRTRLTSADLVTLAREGRTPDNIAAATGYTAATIVGRLRRLGLDDNGDPMPEPTPAPRTPVVSWHASDASWLEHAACAGHDPELWFPKGPGVVEQTAAAKAICDTCPVRARCLDVALTAEDGLSAWYRSGIVGGLTVGERMALVAEAVA